jgi:hypothetical protein
MKTIFSLVILINCSIGQIVINHPFKIVKIPTEEVKVELLAQPAETQNKIVVYVMFQSKGTKVAYERDSIIYTIDSVLLKKVVENIDSVTTKISQSCFDGYGLHGYMQRGDIKMFFACDTYSECGYEKGSNRYTIYFNKIAERELIKLFRYKRNSYMSKNKLKGL